MKKVAVLVFGMMTMNVSAYGILDDLTSIWVFSGRGWISAGNTALFVSEDASNGLAISFPTEKKLPTFTICSTADDLLYTREIAVIGRIDGQSQLFVATMPRKEKADGDCWVAKVDPPILESMRHGQHMDMLINGSVVFMVSLSGLDSAVKQAQEHVESIPHIQAPGVIVPHLLEGERIY